jgi:hypothetical protein
VPAGTASTEVEHRRRDLALDKYGDRHTFEGVNLKRYTFFISEELDAGLKALKRRDGVPEAESVRRALGDYLRKKGVAGTDQPERQRVATRRRP